MKKMYFRRLRTKISIKPPKLRSEILQEKLEKKIKSRQKDKVYHDKRMKKLSELDIGTDVYMFNSNQSKTQVGSN